MGIVKLSWIIVAVFQWTLNARAENLPACAEKPEFQRAMDIKAVCNALPQNVSRENSIRIAFRSGGKGMTFQGNFWEGKIAHVSRAKSNANYQNSKEWIWDGDHFSWDALTIVNYQSIPVSDEAPRKEKKKGNDSWDDLFSIEDFSHNEPYLRVYELQTRLLINTCKLTDEQRAWLTCAYEYIQGFTNNLEEASEAVWEKMLKE